MPAKKYTILFLLYTTQTLPVAFMSTALPTIMRMEGSTLQTITFMSLTSLPLTIRFLWASLIDRYGKRYFNWVTVFTVLYALFFFPAYFLDLQDIPALTVLFTLSMLCMSIQDIALDAFAITALKAGQRSIGNGLQTGGNYLGLLLGGGVLLLFYDKLGWKNTILILSLLTILPIVTTILYAKESEKTVSNQKVHFKDIFSYFTEKEFRSWIPILMLLIIPLNVALSFSKPLLIDKGFGLARVGYMIGISAGIAKVFSGFLTGIVLKSLTLRVKLLAAVASSAAGVIFALLLLHVDMKQETTALVYCIVMGIMVGINMMVMNETSMKYVREGKEGLDYSTQQFLRYLLYTPLLVACGGLVDDYGYAVLFYSMLAISIILGGMVFYSFSHKRERHIF
ncbi:MAG: MFS transporter [Chitinophagaceae bacterium]|nr:MAG: MFS transporter [Chitinophagaceae bacterium]